MNILLPDFLYPAVGFFKNDVASKPTIFTILEYKNNSTPLFTAWFHDGQRAPITIYKKDNKWIEKRYEEETLDSKTIGTAIEIYNPRL